MWDSSAILLTPPPDKSRLCRVPHPTKFPIEPHCSGNLKPPIVFVWMSVPGQFVAGGCLASLIDWHLVQANPLLPTIALAFMVGPIVLGIMQSWAQKKKQIGELREDTHFGQYDKYRLQTLFQETRCRSSTCPTKNCRSTSRPTSF